ncbi:hypothetical protein LOY97_005598, partial [Ophidiomyces ophidiicola]
MPTAGDAAAPALLTHDAVDAAPALASSSSTLSECESFAAPTASTNHHPHSAAGSSSHRALPAADPARAAPPDPAAPTATTSTTTTATATATMPARKHDAPATPPGATALQPQPDAKPRRVRKRKDADAKDDTPHVKPRRGRAAKDKPAVAAPA